MMDDDDMMMFVALFLMLTLFSMVITRRWHSRIPSIGFTSPVLTRVMFAATLIETAAALGLFVYDASTAGPGCRTVLEAVAVGAAATSSMSAYGSIGADDAKKG